MVGHLVSGSVETKSLTFSLSNPSRPTTLISVGVIGISADLMVLGKSLNKVFTSFSHLIQAKNS